MEPQLERPPPLDELRTFLTTPPVVPVPIGPFEYGLIQQLPIARRFTPTYGKLASIVGSAVGFDIVVNSEAETSSFEHNVVVRVILGLDDAMGPLQKIGLCSERDKGDSTSLMTMKSPSGSSLRPDGVLRGSEGIGMLAKVG